MSWLRREREMAQAVEEAFTLPVDPDPETDADVEAAAQRVEQEAEAHAQLLRQEADAHLARAAQEAARLRSLVAARRLAQEAQRDTEQWQRSIADLKAEVEGARQTEDAARAALDDLQRERHQVLLNATTGTATRGEHAQRVADARRAEDLGTRCTAAEDHLHVIHARRADLEARLAELEAHPPPPPSLPRQPRSRQWLLASEQANGAGWVGFTGGKRPLT